MMDNLTQDKIKKDTHNLKSYNLCENEYFSLSSAASRYSVSDTGYDVNVFRKMSLSLVVISFVSHSQMTSTFQPISFSLVSFFLGICDISLKFFLPEYCVAFRGGTVFTPRMAMPKTAVDEDNGLIFWWD